MMQNYLQAYIKLQRASPTPINRNPNMITLWRSRGWHHVFYKRIEYAADNDQYRKGISAARTAPAKFFQKADEKYGERILEFVTRASAIKLKRATNQRKLEELFYFMMALFFIKNWPRDELSDGRLRAVKLKIMVYKVQIIW
jgi:hypothetical protein